MRILALFPLLFPLYLLRGELLGLPITLTEVALIFVFLFFLTQVDWWKKSWWVRHWHWKTLLPLGLFFLAAVIGVLVAPELSTFVDGSEFLGQRRALGILKGWVFAPMLFFFMARVAFREKKSLIPLALNALLATALVLSGHAMWQVLTDNFTTMDGRASGPFESANYLALYIGPVLVYTLTRFLHSNGNERWIMGLSAAVIGMALFFTQSYAGWIAVVSAMALVLILEKRVKKQWVFALGALGALLLLSQLGSDKFVQFLEFTERSSSSVRLEVYEISLALLKDSPLFGIGLGQYEQMYQVNAPEILGQAPMEWVMIHPHNIFLAMWLNMGLLGLVSFVWLVGKASLWLREKDEYRRIAVFMLLTLMVHGLFDTPYFKNDLAFEFWLLMAILL